MRTVYAADHDDARQTHQDNYADAPIVAVHQARDTEPFGRLGRQAS